MSLDPTNPERPSLSEVDSRDTILLNDLLALEHRALESYARSLEILNSPNQRVILTRARTSHFKRSGLLHERIERLGATPRPVQAPWHSVERVLESPPALAGEDSLLSALREEEEQCLANYRESLAHFSPIQRRFVEVELLTEQIESCALMKQTGTH